MKIEETKQELISKIKWMSFPITPKGGQTCGVLPKGSHLICEVTGFEIKINAYRSQLQNRELCLTIYNLFLDEVIK